MTRHGRIYNWSVLRESGSSRPSTAYPATENSQRHVIHHYRCSFQVNIQERKESRKAHLTTHASAFYPDAGSTTGSIPVNYYSRLTRWA